MKNFLIYTLATITGIIVSSVILFFIFIGIVSAMIAITSEKHVNVKKGSILTLKINYPVEERSPVHPFKNFNWNEFKPEVRLGLHDMIAGIEQAASDSNIKGIYIETPVLMAGLSTASELRAALAEFKKSGKFIYSYAEMYTQSAYYLASIGDKVYLNPEGIIDFRGLNAKLAFVKGTLDKLGIEMQVARGNDNRYKTAVETFTRKDMSAENRNQTSLFVNALWNNLIHDIAASRNTTAEALNRQADNFRLKADTTLVSNKIIDGLKYKDQVLDELHEITGTPAGKEISCISISDYHTTVKDIKKSTQKNKIAVIYATGDMTVGEGSDDDNMYSGEISKALRKARADSAVKAIVLRINSGGGSALAAEIIWREVTLARQVKPVIASFGDVAASGGYYMCCNATIITALPNTITGSIGAFGVIPNMKELFNNKLGITFDNVNTNARSDYFSVDKPMESGEKILFEELIENTYETFIQHVADGRNLTTRYADSIGKGRVWDAPNAVRLGLVDTLCSMQQAIKIAAKAAGIASYTIVELPKQSSFLEDLFQETVETKHSRYLRQTLGELYPLYKTLQSFTTGSSIQTRIPYIINLN